MRFLDATAFSCFARRAAESASDYYRVVRNLILDVRDSYRPELHYMRGPGPRWSAKHQSWPRCDARALPLAEEHQPPTAYVRDRDGVSLSR